MKNSRITRTELARRASAAAALAAAGVTISEPLGGPVAVPITKRERAAARRAEASANMKRQRRQREAEYRYRAQQAFPSANISQHHPDSHTWLSDHRRLKADRNHAKSKRGAY